MSAASGLASLVLVPRTFIGGVRGSSDPATPWGWQWVDGTNNSNVECGVQGCGIWSPGSPR